MLHSPFHGPQSECLGNEQFFTFPLPQSEPFGIPDRPSQLRMEGEEWRGSPAVSLAIKAGIVLKELTGIPGLQLARNNGV